VNQEQRDVSIRISSFEMPGVRKVKTRRWVSRCCYGRRRLNVGLFLNANSRATEIKAGVQPLRRVKRATPLTVQRTPLRTNQLAN
jgi:hypothetical protein